MNAYSPVDLKVVFVRAYTRMRCGNMEAVTSHFRSLPRKKSA